MLKCSVRPLVTLVLALVVTAAWSTLSSARELRSPVGSPTAHVTDSVKPMPTTMSGEPDTPQSVPPTHTTNGIVGPIPGYPQGDGSAPWLFWLTSWIRANLLSRATL